MRQSAPSALRNRAPIADVLTRVLPSEGSVLELASGTGEHVVYFAERFPKLLFQPSDPSSSARASIEAHRVECMQPTVLLAIDLDVCGPWPEVHVDAVLCINMIHISPRETVPALMRGAARVLASRGVLITYGAYRIGGRHTAESNASFDAWLKDRDPRFGVRDLEWLIEEADGAGLVLEERIAMPSENFTLVWRKRD
jgi:SAM-dependent methyltransferase